MFDLSKGLEKSNPKKYAKVDQKNLKDMLSERCQSQKTTYYMVPFNVKSEEANSQRQKVDQWLGRAGKEWGVTAIGYGVSVRGDRNILKLDFDVVAQPNLLKPIEW